MTARRHMSFDEAVSLLQAGATGFTFRNHSGEIFTAEKDKDLFITVTHQPAEKETE